jgi:hypothetical protein
LEALITERKELLAQKEKELVELKEEKMRLIDGMVDYKQLATEKTEAIRKLLLKVEERQQKTTQAQNLLSRIVLMLQKWVPKLLPEKKDHNVTMHNAERFLTLFGLSLEQKATILSFRNRSFPIESINEDTTVLGPPSYLQPGEIKEAPEEKKEVNVDEMKKDEEAFQEYSRKVVKDKQLNDARKTHTN